MEEIIVICEDSEDGIFTAVYEVYARKYPLETVRIQTGEEGNLRLFARYEKIATDREKAEKCEEPCGNGLAKEPVRISVMP